MKQKHVIHFENEVTADNDQLFFREECNVTDDELQDVVLDVLPDSWEIDSESMSGGFYTEDPFGHDDAYLSMIIVYSSTDDMEHEQKNTKHEEITAAVEDELGYEASNVRVEGVA